MADRDLETIRPDRHRWHRRLAFNRAWIGLLASGCALHAVAATWPQDAARRSDEAPTTATPYLFGETSCRGCHGHQTPEKGDIRQVESLIWNQHDPHRSALDWGRNPDGSFHSAAGRRAWEIGARLGSQDITKNNRCVGCHSAEVVDPASQQAFSPLEEGVSCVACHGAHVEWVKEHWIPNQPKWRELTRSQKWSQAGMVDLWDPITRARACFSCHAGESHPQNGKALPHDLYEAGHPPLPAFELAAFTEQEVPHWRPLRCKSGPARMGWRDGRMEQTELVMASALVASESALESFAHERERSAIWIDYARFDCASCHHELKTARDARWPQASRGAPGRPHFPRWKLILAQTVIEVLEGEAAAREFARRRDAFFAAIAAQPFGDLQRTAPAAQALLQALESPIARLRAKTAPGGAEAIIDQQATKALMSRIAQIGAGEHLDYDSARQLAWAFRALWRETARVNNSTPHPSSGRIEDLVERLNTMLNLEFRGVRSNPDDCSNTDQLLATQTRRTPVVGAPLESRLAQATDFQPAACREIFEALARHLAGG